MATGSELHRAGAAAPPFPAGLADGEACLSTLVQQSLPAMSVTVARASFERGAATRWHRHEGPQLLVFVAGPGFVETGAESGTEIGTEIGTEAEAATSGTGRVEADGGDTVWCSAGVWHRHGAGSSAGAVHVSTTWGGTQWRA